MSAVPVLTACTPQLRLRRAAIHTSVSTCRATTLEAHRTPARVPSTVTSRWSEGDARPPAFASSSRRSIRRALFPARAQVSAFRRPLPSLFSTVCESDRCRSALTCQPDCPSSLRLDGTADVC